MPLDPVLEARLPSLEPQQAAAELLRGYGGELYSFLVATLREASDADEAFSMFCEDVWRGLADFRGSSSYRTWLYQVARHAAFRLRRGDGRRRKRTALDGGEAAEEIAAEIRTTTASFLKTDVKDKFRALRDMLRPEDKELLVLRLDRELEWSDIAEVLEQDPATLRKRFERLKERLRVLADQAGLLKSSSQ